MYTFSVIDFSDELSMDSREDMLEDGTVRRTRNLSTPKGTLREVVDIPPVESSVHREFFVKGPEDFPVLESFIRIAAKTVFEKPEVGQFVTRCLRRAKQAGADFFPSAFHVFCPTVELMCSYYTDQENAIYNLYDNQDVMEELFELLTRMQDIWLDCARQADVDIYNYAINGLEWLSPDIYERYMIPQAKRINDFAKSAGKLSWIHTCGKQSGLIERDVYRRMGVQVVESLSAPSSGDIRDYAWARNALGAGVTTRGGVNCELFYDEDISALKTRANEVLDGCKGYRHMIGDTNGSVPPYKWETIQAIIDVVRERNAVFK